MVHCIEFFDLGYTPQLESPFWQKIDHIVFDTIRFLFQGKSYAIFSLLFGLGLAVKVSFAQSILLGVFMYMFQMLYSN